MNKVLLVILGVLIGACAYASPPCGISYELEKAEQANEASLLKKVSSTLTQSGGLQEIHISIPALDNARKIGHLTLVIQENGARNLVVGLSPYYVGIDRHVYVINMKREWLSSIDISVIFNNQEKCGEEMVNSSGVKYDLTKAINRVAESF